MLIAGGCTGRRVELSGREIGRRVVTIGCVFGAPSDSMVGVSSVDT